MGALGVLHVVEAFGIRLPDLDLRARHGLAGDAANLAADIAWLAVHAVAHVVAEFILGCIVHIERAEHRGLGTAARFAVVLRGHQRGQAKRVRQQDELLPAGVAGVAHLGQELDPRRPFFLGQLDVPPKGVQVLDQARHDLL
ncbi:hypothetical protein AU476_13040 [Cupriavidus sp. UYMSc13B]|nr:hypothetical protein AU476_13040 [Cupriavidus sp. UYMSc13B]